MTEINFYHLERQTLEQALPKLLEQVAKAGFRTVVLAATQERVDALENLLWTYRQDSFLGHGTERSAYPKHHLIHLTVREENPNQAQILLVVDDISPADPGAYQRCLDMFDGRNEASVAAARERWKIYQSAGHALTYWQQTTEGRWVKNALS